MIAFVRRRPFVGALAVYVLVPLAVVGATLVLYALAALTALVVAGAPEAVHDPAMGVASWISGGLAAWTLLAPIPLAQAAITRRARMRGPVRP